MALCLNLFDYLAFVFEKNEIHGALTSECAHVTCSVGSFCMDGTCQTAVGSDCTNSACEGGRHLLLFFINVMFACLLTNFCQLLIQAFIELLTCLHR